MALCDLQFNGLPSLGRMHSARVILPEGKTGPFPVLYLLHGYGDDHTVWTRRTNLERYVGDLPLIVVMPDTEHGFYTDVPTRPNARYETMVVEDLIGFVDNTFQTVRGPQGRAIAGFSMGGYGALKLALKHPAVFGTALGFAGAYEAARKPVSNTDEWMLVRKATFGDNPIGGPEDLFTIAEKLDPAKTPSLKLSCGVDDYLIDSNRSFHQHLTELGVPHEYIENPGGHNWQYCNLQILNELPFLLKGLGITTSFNPDGML